MTYLNRARRRALEKAIRCIRRGTKIPQTVVCKLPYVVLEHFAAKYEKRLRWVGLTLLAVPIGTVAA